MRMRQTTVRVACHHEIRIQPGLVESSPPTVEHAGEPHPAPAARRLTGWMRMRMRMHVIMTRVIMSRVTMSHLIMSHMRMRMHVTMSHMRMRMRVVIRARRSQPALPEKRRCPRRTASVGAHTVTEESGTDPDHENP